MPASPLSRAHAHPSRKPPAFCNLYFPRPVALTPLVPKALGSAPSPPAVRSVCIPSTGVSTGRPLCLCWTQTLFLVTDFFKQISSGVRVRRGQALTALRKGYTGVGTAGGRKVPAPSLPTWDRTHGLCKMSPHQPGAGSSPSRVCACLPGLGCPGPGHTPAPAGQRGAIPSRVLPCKLLPEAPTLPPPPVLPAKAALFLPRASAHGVCGGGG